jgi:hypothetical protein
MEKGRWWTCNDIEDEHQRRVVLYRPAQLPLTLRRQILDADDCDSKEPPTWLSAGDRQRWEAVNAIIEPLERGLRDCSLDIKLIPIAIEKEALGLALDASHEWNLAVECGKLYITDIWTYLIPLGLRMPSKRWIRTYDLFPM